MKNVQNKNPNKLIRRLVGLTLFALGTVLAIGSTPVLAGGGSVSTTVALCSIGANVSTINTSIESQGKACIGAGGKITKAGEAVPVAICLVGTNAQALSASATARTGCTAVGGKVIEAGQSFPTINNPATSAPSGDRAICVLGSNVAQIDTNVASSLAACTSAGGTVIRAGQPVPVTICILGTEIQQLSANASASAACTAAGGTVVAAGQPLPSVSNPPPTGAAAPGTPGAPGASTTPNRTVTADRAAFESCSGLDDCDFVEKFINPTIKFLAAGVGLIVTIMVIVAGIQYSSAGSDPQKVASAKGKIANAVIALVTYVFLFALLQWLLPGGII